MARPTAWYSYYPADIEADTADLTLDEFGAYQKLLNFHFLQGSIPADTKRIALILRISESKTKRIWLTLQRFFFEENGRYYQRRMLAEIEKSVEKSRVRSEAAHSRWSANEDAKADTNEDAIAMPTTTTATTTKEKEQTPTSKPAVSPCPHQEIISLYSECLPELRQPVPQRWEGSTAAKHLQARWREADEHRNLDFWRDFFGVVKANPWWMGQNDRGWRADLRWLVKRENFDKVVERWAA